MFKGVVHRWVSLLFMRMSVPAHWCPVSCSCLPGLLMLQIDLILKAFMCVATMALFFPLIGLSATSFTLVLGPEKRAGNLLNAYTNS